MKELEVTIRIRNNRLKERRAELGLSQKDLAIAAGISLPAYCGLENLNVAPQADGEWTLAAQKIADFHCVDPSELWPDSVLGLKQHEVVRRLDAATMRQLSSPMSCDYRLDAAELTAAVEHSLLTLWPIERAILEDRFGLDDGERKGLKEIGAKFNLSRERTRQLEVRALKKMREILAPAEPEEPVESAESPVPMPAASKREVAR